MKASRFASNIPWWEWVIVLLCMTLLAIAPWADRWAYQRLTLQGVSDALPGLLGKVGDALGMDPLMNDGYRMYRIAGYLGTWVMITLVIILLDSKRKAWAGGWAAAAYLWGVLLASGAASVVLKPLVRRLRPAEPFEVFRLRPWSERTWDAGGLSFPSEHAAIAFAGAWAMSRLYPRASWVFLFWAAGCAAGRVASQGHYLSDVAASALLAWAVHRMLWRPGGGQLRGA